MELAPIYDEGPGTYLLAIHTLCPLLLYIILGFLFLNAQIQKRT